MYTTNKKRSTKNKKRSTKNKKTNKGRGSATRGWRKEKPSHHERTIMLKKCGRKCFLGPDRSFPVCKKGSCTISQRGVHSAYIRARQWGHSNVAKKAKRLMTYTSQRR